ncbi:hypothetical protein NMY22_g14790 [Coprinellus aureogranulatus]|nr:hypothetical protein NMY22_g14790 [Coprinellus aureogranulatus]
MPNKAIPQTKKACNFAHKKDDLINEGATLYLAQHSKPKEEKMSSQAIAEMLEKRHFEETGRKVKVCYNTIIERSKGRRSQFIGYSEKGWTHSEIGLDWLKLFDRQTSAKAGDEWRLLLVDGHNSHYGYEFLKYAREHKILVLCYPAHTTHVYQGLDVVIFATLKLRLSQECDKWMRKNIHDIRKTLETILQTFLCFVVMNCDHYMYPEAHPSRRPSTAASSAQAVPALGLPSSSATAASSTAAAAPPPPPPPPHTYPYPDFVCVCEGYKKLFKRYINGRGHPDSTGNVLNLAAFSSMDPATLRAQLFLRVATAKDTLPFDNRKIRIKFVPSPLGQDRRIETTDTCFHTCSRTVDILITRETAETLLGMSKAEIDNDICATSDTALHGLLCANGDFNVL